MEENSINDQIEDQEYEETPPPPKPPFHESMIKNLRKDFFYGLFVIIPIIVTIWLVIFSINFISGPVSALFGRNIPAILSFAITIAGITAIGITARNIIGKAILNFFDDLLFKIPFVNVFYRSTKQIIHAVTSQNKRLLSAVLIEYPRKGIWVLAFITKVNNSDILDAEGNEFGKDKYALFVPTTPNPTSGFLVYINKDEVTKLPMSIEESVRVIMSAGVLTPK